MLDGSAGVRRIHVAEALSYRRIQPGRQDTREDGVRIALLQPCRRESASAPAGASRRPYQSSAGSRPGDQLRLTRDVLLRVGKPACCFRTRCHPARPEFPRHVKARAIVFA